MKKFFISLLICISVVFTMSGCSLSPDGSTPAPDVIVPTPTMPYFIPTPKVTATPIKLLTTADGWKYFVENGEVTIYNYIGVQNANKEYIRETSITIPSEINGLPVTTLDHFALCYDQFLHIGDSKFFSDVVSVTIPSSVVNIPLDIFAHCDDLTNVSFAPDSDFSISNDVLYNKDKTVLYLCLNKNIKSFTIPASVKIIASGAFRSCSQLTALTVPSTVETVMDYAFYECTNLKTVTLEEGVKELYNQAFVRCVNLESLTLPQSIEAIGLQLISYTHKVKVYLHEGCYVDTFYHSIMEELAQEFGDDTSFTDYFVYID